MQNANTIESNKIIKTHIGSHLKSLTHFCKSDILWNSIQDNLLNNMQINKKNYNYLKTSGSMIEYYQLYLSYQSLLEYEKSQNIKYDYVVRLRTDVIYTQPLTFNFINFPLSCKESFNFEIEDFKNNITTILLKIVLLYIV